MCHPTTRQNVCAIANTTSQPSPWVYDDKAIKDTPDDPFPANALFEGGIDLTALNLDTGCFSTFIAETRSSTSTDATLSDLAIGSFSLCANPVITTQVKQDGTSTGSNGHITIGESVTDFVHIEGTKGIPTGTVDFWHCFNASSTPTCTVPASGTPFDTKTLNANGNATSDPYTPGAVGHYCFIVDYHPAAGSHYLPGSHTNATTSASSSTSSRPRSRRRRTRPSTSATRSVTRPSWPGPRPTPVAPSRSGRTARPTTTATARSDTPRRWT